MSVLMSHTHDLRALSALAYAFRDPDKNLKNEDFDLSASITFSCSTESHANTVIHGKMAEKGYDLADIQRAMNWAKENKKEYNLFDLKELSGSSREGYVLVIRNLVGHLTDPIRDEYVEKVYPKLDRKFVNFQTVRTKYARGNAEIGDSKYESDLAPLEVGQRIEKGTKLSGIVIPYTEVPRLSFVRNILPEILGEKATSLRAEVNHYGPPSKSTNEPRFSFQSSGIGFHGDSERPDVCCLVLGRKKALHFQPFRRTLPEGKRVEVVVGDGDFYVMCQNACGHSWSEDRRSDKIIHYRHAAGTLESEGKRSRFLPTNEQITRRVLAKIKRTQEKATKRKKPLDLIVSPVCSRAFLLFY